MHDDYNNNNRVDFHVFNSLLLFPFVYTVDFRVSCLVFNLKMKTFRKWFRGIFITFYARYGCNS